MRNSELCIRRRVLQMAALAALLWLAAQAGAAISGFSPASGPVGTVVTVNGSGFSVATNFLFNGATYADFEIISSSQIQVVVPLGAASGPLSVVVGGVTSASSASFMVAPFISSFNPASGAHPTAVTIFGGNFVTGGTTVSFTGASPVNGMVTAQNQVVAVVPTNAADGPITVSTSAGVAVTLSNFVVSAAPTITDFSPSAGTNGTTVVIDGSNFITNATTVDFGSYSASVSVVAATQLQAVVPNGATNGPITVRTVNGSYVSSNIFLTGFTAGISDFNPAFGGANANVIIDGFGFSSMTSLVFAGVTLAPNSSYITAHNDAQLQVVVPPGASNGPITVVSSHGSFTTTSNFLTSPGPVILDFNPAAAGPGTNVTLDGFNFATGMSVKFGGKSAAGFTVTQGNQLKVAVPTGATNAPISVSLGSDTFTTSSNFIVTGAGPVITGFSPSNGVQGMTVTITGSFASLGSPGVEFNGTPAPYTLTSYNQVQAVVPAAATSGPISLLNSGGASASSALFYLQPWITNFSPASAVVNTTVTITGRNLTNTASLTVNGVPWNFTATAAQITAIVPTNASTGPVIVGAPGGNYIATNVFKLLPQINSFSPLAGPTNSLVTLYGTGLLNVTNVQFNGVNAKPASTNVSQVTVVVPYNAASGPITVVTPDGSSTSAASFAVTRPSLVVLTKTASSPVLGPGTNVVYTLTVTNEGPSIVSGLTVSDPLPASLNYISSSSTLGTCSFRGGVVTCNAGILTNNFAFTVTITGNSSASGDVLNTATMNFVEGNLNSQDNTASAEVVYLINSQRTLGIQRLTAPPAIVLSWPSSAVSFLLEYSTNLASPTNWLTNTAVQTVIGGQIYVTNTTAGPSSFFQLKAR